MMSRILCFLFTDIYGINCWTRLCLAVALVSNKNLKAAISNDLHCVVCLATRETIKLLYIFLDENLLRNSNKKSDDSQQQHTAAPPVSVSTRTTAEEGPQLSEFVVSVSAVLGDAGVDNTAKSRVMNVVNRLVEKLNKAEQEKDTATLQLKGKRRTKVQISLKLHKLDTC